MAWGREGEFEHAGLARLQTATEARLGVLAAGLREYAFVVLDAGGLVQGWNAGATHVLGYRGREIVGRPVSVVYPVEAVAAGDPEAELAQAVEFDKYVGQGWRVRRDGTRFWAHVVITVQRSGAEGLQGYLYVVRDETEAGVRQQRSSRRFSDLFDLTPVGIALFDSGGQVLDVNEALCDLLGYRAYDLMTMPAVGLLHPDDRDAALFTDAAGESEPLNQARARQRVLLRADGGAVTCEVRSASSMADDGTRFWLVVFQDITEWVAHAETLRYQASHDDLTGLLNRAGLTERLADLIAGGAERVGVLFCDLDNFKRVNDGLGHAAGDELLRALAQRLTQGLPPGCIPARLSGDEYLIICSDVDAVGGLEPFALWVAELLRTTVPVRGQPVTVSASVGAAMLDRNTVSENLLRYADTAMFHAKTRGPGRVSLATPELIATRESQIGLEGQLRQALKADSLVLHYQPILNGARQVIMVEALLRWPHPERGLLPPNVILPVAKQGNLLRDLDRWVLRSALTEAASWPGAQGHPVAVAVNLADLLPHDPAFVDEITTAITNTGIDPYRLVLEMVETSLIELPTKPREAMIELAEQGVRFALDDFGTGYSSLARLKDLPTQIIKLDRQFVTDIETNPADHAIAQAMIGMGHAMGHSTVAEGVETTGQLHALEELGIDAFQGWLFSPALPPDELHTYLHTPPAAP